MNQSISIYLLLTLIAILMKISKCSPTEITSQEYNHVQSGYTYNTYVTFTSSADSVTECSDLCRESPDCLTFTFDLSSKWCQGRWKLFWSHLDKVAQTGAEIYIEAGYDCE